MGLLDRTLTVPFRVDADGVIRVGATRVTLDTIIARFRQGDAAEQIAMDYDVLDLRDVYDVVTFYRHNKADVDDYLAHERQAGETLRQLAREMGSTVGIRDRLLARRAEGDKTSAAAFDG